MKFEIGDKVTTDPSGPYLGRRKAVVVELRLGSTLIRYTDYPSGNPSDAWIMRGLKRLKQ